MTFLPAKYRVLRTLGEGGFGRVVLAQDEELGRRVAIKLLDGAALFADPLVWPRFVEEARLGAALKHPSIVRLLDYGLEPSAPYLVFELVEGHSLADEISRSRRLDIARTLEIARHVLDALAHAHGMGTVHRDIKPHNILLRAADGAVMLADFGIALHAEGRAFRTQAGVVLGTISYLAPELFRGRDPHPGSDLYGLGCTLVECLSGRPPFVGDTVVRIVDQHLHAPPPRLDTLATDVPAWLCDAVNRALEKDPDRRFASADEMRRALVEPRRQNGAAMAPGRSRSWRRTVTTDTARRSSSAVRVAPGATDVASPPLPLRIAAALAIFVVGGALGLLGWWSVAGHQSPAPRPPIVGAGTVRSSAVAGPPQSPGVDALARRLGNTPGASTPSVSDVDLTAYIEALTLSGAGRR